jgi:hypothetical protein
VVAAGGASGLRPRAPTVGLLRWAGPHVRSHLQTCELEDQQNRDDHKDEHEQSSRRRGVLPPHDQFDRMHARARGHRQGCVLPIGHPRARTGCQTHCGRVLPMVISINRCERNRAYVKSPVRPMRGLKGFACADRLFPVIDAVQLVERDVVRVPPSGVPSTAGHRYAHARQIAAFINSLGPNLVGPVEALQTGPDHSAGGADPLPTSEHPRFGSHLAADPGGVGRRCAAKQPQVSSLWIDRMKASTPGGRGHSTGRSVRSTPAEPSNCSSTGRTSSINGWYGHGWPATKRTVRV